MADQPAPQPKTTSFLDLPGEIRNHIYFLCLTPPTTTTIHLVRTPPQLYVSSEIALDMVILGVADDAAPSCVAILATCKTIHNEATSILYGSNTFRIDIPIILKTFVREIGDSIGQVRSIDLAGIAGKSDLSTLLNIISKSKFDILRDLILPYTETTRWFKREQVVARLMPLMRKLKSKRKKAGSVDVVKVEEVVRFADPAGTGLERTEMDVYTADLREELRWQLKW